LRKSTVPVYSISGVASLAASPATSNQILRGTFAASVTSTQGKLAEKLFFAVW